MKPLELNVYDRKKARLALSTEEGNNHDTVVSILYVPHVDGFEHEHIELDYKQATKMRDWLNEYLSTYEKVRRLQFNT